MLITGGSVMACAIRRSLWFFLISSSAALHVGSAFSANDPSIEADAPIDAIWQVHEVRFQFRSGRTSYACDSLQRKVAGILRALGARGDIAVDCGCLRGELVHHASVQVTLATPVPATDENVRRATTFDGRDELVARLHGRHLPTEADLERFPATWTRISLQRDRRSRVNPSDCDLLHALAKHVFPRMALRVEKRTFHCASSGANLPPRVEVAALLPMKVAPIAFVAR